MNIDRYCEPSGNGWRYDFPNSYQPSVTFNRSKSLKGLEIYVPGENGREVVQRLGGQGNPIVGLTTDQVEAKLAQIALLPAFDPDDPNPVVLAEPSVFDGQPPVLTHRDGSQQYGPYTSTA